MKKNGFLFLLFIFFAFIFSCSTNRSTMLSRNYHALTSEYNILFNSRENLEKAVDELKQKNETDFYRELSLEGIEFDDKIYLPGQSKSNYISKAEEKATKAVQKHSMEIRGVERNPKMDEAMLLLGMSRYYDQRYLAAMDAFNYALDNYYDTNLRNELLLWRAKTLLKLGNTRLARYKLLQIAETPDTKPDTKAWAYAFISESFREDEPTDTVAYYLTKAARTAKSRDLQHTLAFKAAQVWEKLFRKDSALMMTDLILKHKSPEKFILHTQWYRMHLTKEDTLTHEKSLKKLDAQLKNYYYNKFFSDIHFHKAEILEVRHDTAGAIRNYTQAARSSNKSLKRLAYSKMAEIYWNKKNYLNTGKYLDSMLTVMDKNTLDYLLVSQRRRSIDQIVKWEETIRHNDSILRFIKLDSSQQIKKIKAYIAALRKKKEEELKATQEQAGGTFYFYNESQVEAGKALFKKQWGERRLEDLWRLTNKYGTARPEEEAEKQESAADTLARVENDSLSVEFYLNQLPRTQKQIDSIKNLIVKAHLYLGMNYANDKFREYGLAEKNLQTVLDSHPTKEQESQAYYNLYKIYTKTNRKEEAERIQKIMETRFPESPYTKFIQNPAEAEVVSSKEFLEAYKEAYNLFEQGKWSDALAKAQNAYEKFKDHPSAPKLLLLSAKIKGKLQGIDSYIAELERLIKLHPDTDYASHAENLIKKLKILKIKYDKPKDEFPYYLVHIYRDTTGMGALKQCLTQIFEEQEAHSKYFFTDRFNDSIVFLISGNYLSKESAGYVLEKLKEKKCPTPETYIMSRNKYINLQLNKTQPQPPKN